MTDVQRTAPDIAHLTERVEWMHYLGTKSFPHETPGTCELCDAESKIRDALLDYGRLFEQLEAIQAAVEIIQAERDGLREQYAAAQGSSEAMGRALAAAHTKITGLEEQLEAIREAPASFQEDAPAKRPSDG